MIRRIIGFGISRTIFAVVFVAGELFLAPGYFRNLYLLFLNWAGIEQGTYLIPGTSPWLNALFLSWAFALLAIMVAISNAGENRRKKE